MCLSKLAIFLLTHYSHYSSQRKFRCCASTKGLSSPSSQAGLPTFDFHRAGIQVLRAIAARVGFCFGFRNCLLWLSQADALVLP